MKDRITEAELAKMWDISTRTLQIWRKQGKGPQYLSVGKNTILYRPEDVHAYEVRHTHGGEIPARAKQSMLRAANFLELISRWKISESTQGHILALRDELRCMVSASAEEAK